MSGFCYTGCAYLTENDSLSFTSSFNFWSKNYWYRRSQYNSQEILLILHTLFIEEKERGKRGKGQTLW